MPLPRLLLRGMAAMRVLIGAALLIAPRRLMGALLAAGTPAEETVLVLRMLAVRDAALGLGALLAERHGSEQVRGWAEAGALSDAVDALAFGSARSLRPALRALSAACAATAAGTIAWAARRLD